MSTEAEEIQKRIAEEKAALRQGTSQGNAQTFPMPAPAVGPPSVPPLPGGNANAESAPLSRSGADESQGGGADLLKDRGTTAERMESIPSSELVNLANTSSDAASDSGNTGKIKGGKKMKQEANTAIEEMTGQSVKKTMEDFQKKGIEMLDAAYKKKEITKERHKGLKEGWKNVFNVIPRDDMGLFLMDFGMRMMAAGETMSFGGAIGSAGTAALQGSLGRQQAKQAGEQERTQAGLELGMKGYGAETSRISAEASRTSAEAQSTRALTAGGGYRGEKAWLLDLGRKMGKTDEEVWSMFNKVKSSDSRRQDLLDFVLDAQSSAGFTDVDPILNKKYREFSKADINKWVNQVMQMELEGSAVSGALSNNTAGSSGAASDAMSKYSDKSE